MAMHRLSQWRAVTVMMNAQSLGPSGLHGYRLVGAAPMPLPMRGQAWLPQSAPKAMRVRMK